MNQKETQKTIKEKIYELKGKVKEKVTKMRIWCEENTDLAVLAGTVVLSFAGTIIKTSARKTQKKEARKLKTNFIYDTKMNHYYELRRPVTNDEWILIEMRKDQGENLGYILNDMDLLK